MSVAARLPSGRRGQALALAMLALNLLVLWLGIGAPLYAWYASEADRLDDQRRLVARMAALAATLPDLARQASAARAGGNTARQGDSDALAAAALQQRLEHLASDAGIEIASVETLPTERSGGIKRIRLRVTWQASWPDLLTLLGAIETDTDSLLIGELELRADATHDADAPRLTGQFTLIALRADASAEAAP